MTPCHDCGSENTFVGMGKVVDDVCEYYLCYECYEKFNKERNGT